MWPFGRVSNECIVVYLDPLYVALAQFSITTEKIPYQLRSFRVVPFEHYEYATGILFNPTRLAHLISDFSTASKIKTKKLIIGLQGSQLKENIVSSTAAMLAETMQDFFAPALLGDYEFLYQQDCERSVYYCCAMNRENLFQLQLFALCNGFDLIAVTTSMVGYCALCRKKEGAQFSEQRFGDALMTQKNQIQKLITINDLAAMLRIDGTITMERPDDVEQIGRLFGLLMAGE